MFCQNGMEGIPTDDGLLLVAHGELDAATADECARAGVPVGVTVPDDGPVRRIVDVPSVRSSVPVVACPAPGLHEADHPPRECRFSGAVVTGYVAGRTGGGPGARRGISPDAVHRPHVSGGATRSRWHSGQAGDPENAPGHRRPSEIRTRPPTNA
ncbi:hypothetical protein IFM12275_68600 [Nocardia sputorum]|uniref:Uncharacterized protein n=1 Tax=Nocardia sputorum TaxID=2984338 RepID=A0ABM8CUI3_9NOCA|nr:hypothetical protein IFM12275_68600 [Nocardia sputorum]BDT98634.1 hypothetical protein IFM12276_16630 [Nocardia sputorum]